MAEQQNELFTKEKVVSCLSQALVEIVFRVGEEMLMSALENKRVKVTNSIQNKLICQEKEG